MSLEKKYETVSFHLDLLVEIADIQRYPLKKMLIEKEVTKEEYLEIMELLAVLNKSFQEQKEEGMLDYSNLLIHFAGMLTSKLHPDQVIQALKAEHIYPELMDVFLKILEENK